MRIEAYLRESPLFAVMSTARQFETRIMRVLGDDELTFLEALVIAAIFFETPPGVRPSKLAETLHTTRGNLSHCVSALEARGLLMRKIDSGDARGYQLTLKPYGRKTAVRVIGAFDRMQREFEGRAGKVALRDMLETLRNVDKIFGVLVAAK